MSGDYSITIVKGHLGNTPVLSVTPGGQSVCNFSLAKNDDYVDRNTGERVEKKTWYRVTAWNKTAEACAKYLVKGSGATVQCNLTPGPDGHPRIWFGDDGVARAGYEVRADVVKFDDTRAETEARRAALGIPNPGQQADVPIEPAAAELSPQQKGALTRKRNAEAAAKQAAAESTVPWTE